MSDVRSTHLRDARPNRRHGNVPKLQCCGHRSERFYLTSASSAPRRCPPYLQFRRQGIYVDLVSLPSKPAEVEDDTEFLVTRVHSHFGEVFASVSAPVFPLEVAAFIPMFRGPGREDL